MLGNSEQDQKDYISEINVTPLVDVVLVLLIIFMISAPLLMNDISLNLPKTKKVQTLTQSKTSVTISINSTGQIYLENRPVNYEKLEDYFKQKAENKFNTLIYLRADEKTDYRFIAKTLAILKGLNLSQISLVTETDKN